MNNNNFILCCVLSEVGRNGKPVFRLVYQVFSSVLKSTSILRMFVVLTQPEECLRLLLQVKEPLPTHSLVFFFFFFFFFFFTSAPLSYVLFCARGTIKAAAASLCPTHGNAGSDLTTPQLVARLDF